MNASLALIIAMAGLFGAGIYVMLERSLTRVLIGFLLVGNAVNILILLMSGGQGPAPILGDDPNAHTTDPLPQALILTAIVITLGSAAFLLALIYRNWWLSKLSDEVPSVDEDDLRDVEEVFETTSEDESAISMALEESDDSGDS
ncbi:MAG: NADH-quinone oxidoreductase subunit K [Microbacteriaceae bacterium]|nr:NADH-quinone oxidoreductase subunit K [Microbacteriaceae bacterium]